MARGTQEGERTLLILPDELRRSRLISDDYRKLQETLHKDPLYGVASTHYAPVVAKVVNQYGVEELLDYGAGKGRLAQTLGAQRMVTHPLRIQHYDPAIPDWADAPEPCEMVACIDVLEHIEPELIGNVLDDLQRVTRSIGLFTVATTPAVKVLEDGRNAHLIVEPPAWWVPQIMERWDMHTFQKTEDGFLVLVMAREIQH